VLASEQERLFKQWLGEHKGLMFKVVRAYAASPQDQDDLFQEILLQVWSSIPAFRGNAMVSTWIYRVALNTAFAWKRGEKKHRRRHQPLMAANQTPDLEEDRPNAQRNRELLDFLYAEIRRLPKVESSLVLLYLDGLSYREMADVLGISETNVGVKLNRIKKRLAESLKGAADGF
jgi:RNA polymerase sigma-70 factor (ECF subfamily)